MNTENTKMFLTTCVYEILWIGLKQHQFLKFKLNLFREHTI